MPAAAIPGPMPIDPIASLTERFRRSRMSLDQKLSRADEAIGLTETAVSGFAKSATGSGPVKLSRMEQKAFTEEELDIDGTPAEDAEDSL